MTRDDAFERRWKELGSGDRRRIARMAYKGQKAPDADTARLIAGFARGRLSAWYESPWAGVLFAVLAAVAMSLLVFDGVSIATVAGVAVGYGWGLGIRRRRLRAALEANERKTAT